MKSIIKNKMVLVAFTAILLLLVIAVVIYNINKSTLSAGQISALREQYPICGIDAPQNISMRNAPLSEVIEISDSFVYGEVVGDVATYTVDASTGNTKLDDKRNQNGINDSYDFYEYTISVISDSEGMYAKGEKITISSNVCFMDYNPKLSAGMKIIVPVFKDENSKSRHYYCVDGMYYVTDTGYAISAFDEAAMPSEKTLSGKKVNDVLNELKK